MVAKNTIFSPKTTLNCNGKLLDISSPKIMGIINVTPDSFYDGGFINNEKELLLLSEKMLNEGASILDIGGISTRPGADSISIEEELNRVISSISLIKKQFPGVIISIDTYRSKVAEEAIIHGASMVNDISAGSFDANLFETVARYKVPYILMHMQGTPQSMQEQPHYEDVVMEVFEFFKQKIFELNTLGVYDLLIDPGFGFGKTIAHNYQLLKQLSVFHVFGYPILAGLSRKSMICKVLKVDPPKALPGTIVLNTIALLHGATILRVHDVREAKETIKLIEAMNNDGV
ncbi:MAG: dihydropteroate synthase [Chitinophagales bacterium]|nr:dihydropteroate synthase [Chitinophagales bacterium]